MRALMVLLRPPSLQAAHPLSSCVHPPSHTLTRFPPLAIAFFCVHVQPSARLQALLDSLSEPNQAGSTTAWVCKSARELVEAAFPVSTGV
jgi:hypothetical protein